jgi:serine/threonine-protein kinase RsbT
VGTLIYKNGAHGSLPIRDDHDVVSCRQTVRRITSAMGFSVTGQTMLVTAASELARNTLIYGGGGMLTWAVLEMHGKVGVHLCFSDRGPGIANIPQAMTNRWSSGRGLGLGLPGAKRLVNQFEIEPVPGEGTRVCVLRWK